MQALLFAGSITLAIEGWNENPTRKIQVVGAQIPIRDKVPGNYMNKVCLQGRKCKHPPAYS